MIATHVLSFDDLSELVELPEPMPEQEAEKYVLHNAHMLGSTPQKLVVGTVMDKDYLLRAISPETVMQAVGMSFLSLGMDKSVIMAYDVHTIHERFVDFLLQQGSDQGLFVTCTAYTRESTHADSPESQPDRPDADA